MSFQNNYKSIFHYLLVLIKMDPLLFSATLDSDDPLIPFRQFYEASSHSIEALTQIR